MIYPKPYKRESVYYFKYTAPSGKRKQKCCETTDPGKAQKFVIKFMDQQEGIVLNTTTLKKLLEPWRTGVSNPRYERYQIEGKQYGTQQVKNIKYLLEHIKDHRIMKMKASAIKKTHALALRSWLLEEIPDKPQTINKIFTSLGSIYSEHIYREELEYNPFSSVGKVAYTPKKVEILQPVQVLQLIEALTDPTAQALCSLLAFSGMRQGEAMALDWNQVQGSVVNISRAFKSGSSNDIGLPKWGKEREIMLPQVAYKSLPDRGIGLVFTISGHRVYQKWWYTQFHAALKTAKLPHITPHSLRHTLNSTLLVSNVSPFMIQKYLGWSSGSSMITKVQEGYTHITSKDLQIVADAIDKIYTPKKKKAAGN
jgi:integrase